MAKYKIIDPKGAYMPRSPELHLLELGNDRASAEVYRIRAPVTEMLPEGTVIEFAGVPGPHLEAIDETARVAMAAYWDKYPNASLDPTRHLPLGQDPMGGKTVEQLVTGLLERMEQDRPAGSPGAVGAGAAGSDGAGSAGSDGATIAALVGGQQAMQQAMATLMAAVAALLPPSKPGRAV
jgi:hypothetical protein